jgi:hypothetical protein
MYPIISELYHSRYFTVTFAEAVVITPELEEQVTVKDVVVVSAAVVSEPEAPPCPSTVPSCETSVHCETPMPDHESVAFLPETTFAGFGIKLTIGLGGVDVAFGVVVEVTGV